MNLEQMGARVAALEAALREIADMPFGEHQDPWGLEWCHCYSVGEIGEAEKWGPRDAALEALQEATEEAT